ncbi:MAG: DUF4352 domain-containing protein [Ruminococcus sp.]|nr:DUF4352 domain-containing protein [Ruminococcus sp.]
MKKFRFTALTLVSALSIMSAFSCSDKTVQSDSDSSVITSVADRQPELKVPNKYSGDSKKTNSVLGQSTEVNNTVFSLNNVISVTNPAGNGNDYVYINVTIKNNTDTEYQINSLNNFFISLPDETESLSDIRAKLYAINNYPQCVDDPITIPANGEFTGYITGGFLVPTGTDSFTVGFFPTLDNDRDRSNAIISPVTAENITHDDSALR